MAAFVSTILDEEDADAELPGGGAFTCGGADCFHAGGCLGAALNGGEFGGG